MSIVFKHQCIEQYHWLLGIRHSSVGYPIKLHYSHIQVACQRGKLSFLRFSVELLKGILSQFKARSSYTIYLKPSSFFEKRHNILPCERTSTLSHDTIQSTSTKPGTNQKRPKSGGQNFHKHKLWESDTTTPKWPKFIEKIFTTKLIWNDRCQVDKV